MSNFPNRGKPGFPNAVRHLAPIKFSVSYPARISPGDLLIGPNMAREIKPWDLTWHADEDPYAGLGIRGGTLTIGFAEPPRLGWCRKHRNVYRLPKDEGLIVICGLTLERPKKLPPGVVYTSGMMCDAVLEPWDELMAALIISGEDGELRDRTAFDMIHDRQRTEYLKAEAGQPVQGPTQGDVTLDALKAKWGKKR